jgi:hypothetical protein
MIDFLTNIKPINGRENRRDNEEWTIQRNLQHWVYKTQDEDKQSNNKKKPTQNRKPNR